MASRIGIPRVTVYLLVGLVLGPHALLRLVGADSPAGGFLLGPDTETPLAATGQLALGFILFGVGSEFRLRVFRRVGPRILRISSMEMLTTAVLVGLAVWAVTGDWRLAVVAPALATASAPSATLVTLREIEAEGPASRALILLVGHNNLVTLLVFPLLLALAFGSGNPLEATAASLLALAGGGGLGLCAAVGLEAIAGRREFVLLGLLVVLAALGLVHWAQPGATGLGMLACFAAGVVVANGSPHADALFRYVENTVYPLYVLFFIDAGRDLHIEALASAGVLGALFIAARSLGKLGGVELGLRAAGWQQQMPRGLGAGLLCQAGVALGLVTALASAAPEATAELRHVVVASVVFFELLGPWLVRRTAIRAAEVKLSQLYPHSDATGFDALRWVWLEIRRNLGLVRGDVVGSDRGARVAQAMHRRPATIGEGEPFERVLRVLGETAEPLLAVLDAGGRFQGVISYDEVKSTLYDPVLRSLIIARDLTARVDDPLRPDDSLAAALDRMDHHRVHSWPVVEDGRLLGMVRRAELYAVVRRAVKEETEISTPESARRAAPGS